MSDHDFLFALDVSDEAHFDAMLAELTGTVLTFVGFPPPAVEDLRQELRQALRAGPSNGSRRCDVRFRAHEGELVVTVAYAGGAEWRATRALP